MPDLNEISLPADTEYGSGNVNSPKLDPKTLKPDRRAITDGKQAIEIAKTLEKNNEKRNQTDAIIWKKYNGGQPFNPSDLEAAGEDWRNNFPTGFLSGIVDRVVPAPVQTIDSARYLTSAALNAKDQSAQQKSDFFREKITRAIRQWDGWKDFTYSLATEDVLMGGAFVAWLDDDCPWPDLYRRDKLFVPDGTGTHAKTVQVFAAKKDWMIHEAVEFIADGKETSDSAGWDVEAFVETINEAMPKQTMTEGNTAQAREFEDIIREGNMGFGFQTGAKIIEVWHILATETSGKVTHFIVDRKGKNKVLFQRDDRYDKMTDCLTLFTLQPGNGKFYGSKGLGRILINMHIAIERARNVMFDQLYLAGLLVLQTEEGKAPSAQLKVRHPFVLLASNAKISQEQVVAQVDEYLKLDAKISQLAELAAGAYIPDPISGTTGKETTATEEHIDYERETQQKIAFLSRFWGQFSDLVSCMTRRLCKKGSSDPIAQALYKDLTEGEDQIQLSEDEINELANAPAAEVVQDLTQTQNQQVVQVGDRYRGDPDIDQVELKKMEITALSSPQVADRIMLKDAVDQTVEAEAVRQQLMETEAIIAGAPGMPVSPRDRHDIHLKVIAPDLAKGFMGAQQKPDPKVLDALNAGLQHAEAHVQMWEQQGAPKEAVKPYIDAIKKADAMLHEMGNMLQQQQQQPPEGQVLQGQPVGGDPNAPPPEQPAPIHPEEHMLKITSSIDYKTAPWSIRRQIEAAAGFKPATDDEDKSYQASQAMGKHPNVVEKTTPPPPASPPEPVA